MKDIIATLEAKRTAARAGGGEKRHAPHAKGKLIPFLVIVASVLFVSQVMAIGSRWTSPAGDFVAWLPDGWEQDPTPQGNPDAMIVVSARPRDPMRTCGVSGRAAPAPPSMSQAQGNSVIARFNVEQMMQGFPAAERRLISFSNEAQDGVQISSIVFEYEEPPTNERIRSYGRTFALVRGGEFRYYSLNCGVRLPVAEADLATVERFMNSLSFLPEQ